MERPFANTHDSDQSPFESDSGSSRRPNLSIAAGHIVTRGESARQTKRPVRGAEALIAAALSQPESPQEDNHNTQYSSWHRMEMDDDGKVMPVTDQHYGREFFAQASVEQNDPGTSTYQVPIPSATPPVTQPAQAPQPVHQNIPVQPATASYQYPQPVMPQTYTQPSTPPSTPQPDPVAPQPVTPVAQHPAFSAVPVVPAPQPQQPQEPRLAPGAMVDAQHRLPAPHPVKRFVQSPWTWLVVGIAMIIYFLA